MNATTIEVRADDDSRFAVEVWGIGPGPRPGLVICSEAFGLTPHMRGVADRFAALGFVVAVPDLLFRIEPGMDLPYDERGLRRASEIADLFDKEQGAEDLRPVLKALRARPDCTGKVGVLGFCIGGTVAYLSAARLKADACVSYYGKGIEDFLTEGDAVTCPTVLHYGGADRFIPESTVDDVRNAFGPRPNIEVYDYPGVDHGFNSDDRRAFDPEAARLAMGRTMRVLDAGLRA